MQTLLDTQGEPQLRRVLNLPLLTLYGLGVTVGAGIYVLVGTTVAEAGTFAPVAFLIAACVVGFTAFSYAELSTRFPVSAGEAAYVDAGFGRQSLTLLVGALVAMAGIVSAAAVAIGAAGYLAFVTGLTVQFLTIAIVVTMGLIAWWGIMQSVLLAGLITLLEVAGLIFVVVWSIGLDAEPLISLSDTIPPLIGPHWAGIAAASVLAFFAFVGFEDIANVAEEVKDPRHTLPRAIVATLLLATLLYIATTVAVLTAVPKDTLAQARAPLAMVFQTAPASIQIGFSALAVVATMNGVLIQTIMASRVIFGLADRGQLPKVLAHISPLTHTPTWATLAVTLIILILSQTLAIDALAARTSQIVLLVFVMVNLALLRIKQQPVADTDFFRVPRFVPIAGIATSAFLLISSFL